LAACYENGFGVERNLAEAVRWLRQAAELGSVEARRRLEELELD
ncbi:MAG: SEL1-like repeat protein, partial [Thermoguttaceae bacterium]|nr:SEL1-like repeat protein [Thermoguttaceae bacterium]